MNFEAEWAFYPLACGLGVILNWPHRPDDAVFTIFAGPLIFRLKVHYTP